MYFAKLRDAMDRANGLLPVNRVQEERWAVQIFACCAGLRLLARETAAYDAHVRFCSQFFAQFEAALQAFCALSDSGRATQEGGFREEAPAIDAAFNMLESAILFVREKALRTGYADLCEEEEYLLDFFATSGLWPLEDRHNDAIDTFYVKLPAAVSRDAAGLRY
ncbi:hypothetical protein LJC23_05345 [Desulfovibrio sp. OttesenSCG-928-I05]|nr:hypothetical protein [Desulfovibrio sp. OttesenSCG-928-I05]